MSPVHLAPAVRRVVCIALATLLAACAVQDGAVTAPTAPNQVTLAAPVADQPQLFMMMYDCEYTYGWGCSEWGGWMNGGPWDNPILDTCHTTPEICAFRWAPGGPGAANPTVPEPFWFPDEAEESVPDCSGYIQPQSKSEAYCSGGKPSGIFKTRITSAISRMRAKGGVCASLATIADALLANDRLKIFSGTQYPWWGGFAPPAGGASGPNSYMGLSDYFFKFAWDGDHRSNNGTLQSALAHELDHLLQTNAHVPGDATRTVHQDQCDDI